MDTTKLITDQLIKLHTFTNEVLKLKFAQFFVLCSGMQNASVFALTSIAMMSGAGVRISRLI
jgi:hypothetical protein